MYDKHQYMFAEKDQYINLTWTNDASNKGEERDLSGDSEAMKLSYR